MATTAKKTTSTNKNASINKEPAAAIPASAENKEPVKAQTFTKEQVDSIVADAIAKALAAMKPEQSAPVQPAAKDEGVVMRFFAEVNDGNVVLFGKDGRYGQVTGKMSTVIVSKNDFIGGFRDTTVQSLLKNRVLVVLSGLDDKERKLYGVDYKEGEILDPETYEELDAMGDKILDIYPKLHMTYKGMVARHFREKSEKGTLRLGRETLVKLNRLSREDFKNAPQGDARRYGIFSWIIEKMNQEDAL